MRESQITSFYRVHKLSIELWQTQVWSTKLQNKHKNQKYFQQVKFKLLQD